jgi:hypothetical protein
METNEERSAILEQAKEEPSEEPTGEEETHDDGGGGISLSSQPPPTLKADPWNCIPMPLETTLRMTAAAFLAYSLSYAGDAGSVHAIPPSLAFFIGLLAPLVVTRLPIIAPVATPGPMICVMTLLLFALGSTTALLCAATVSDGLFVALSAVWCFWISGLRFGPTALYSYIFTAVLAVIFGLLGLGMLDAVQNGIVVQVDRGTLIEMVQGRIDPPDSLRLTVVDLLAAFEKFLDFLEQIITTGRFCVDVEEGFLRGQEVCATYNEEDDTVLVAVNGGIWLIKRLWTTTGVDNPFALFPNFLIVACWACLCAFFVAPLLPPVRTARYVLSVRALPLTLRDAAWYCNRWRPGHRPKTEEEIMVGKRLMKSVDTFHGGAIAVVTAFEPRVLDYRCGIARCTWKDLKEVTSQVERAALRALILRSGLVDSVESPGRFDTYGQIYEKNAEALETRIRISKQNDETTSDAENPSRTDSLGFEDSCKQISRVVDDWLVSFHAEPNSKLTFKDGLSNVAKTTLLWILPTIGLFARLVEIPLLPVLIYKGIYKKDVNMFMHYVKFTIGFTALVCMSVYWDAYNDFELNEDDPEGGIQLISGGPLKSFEGWHLVS